MSLLISDPIENMKLLNNKVDVLVREFNSVLNEMQVTVQGLASLTTAGLRSLESRLTNLELHLQHIAEHTNFELKKQIVVADSIPNTGNDSQK